MPWSTKAAVKMLSEELIAESEELNNTAMLPVEPEQEKDASQPEPQKITESDPKGLPALEPAEPEPTLRTAMQEAPVDAEPIPEFAAPEAIFEPPQEDVQPPPDEMESPDVPEQEPEPEEVEPPDDWVVPAEYEPVAEVSPMPEVEDSDGEQQPEQPDWQSMMGYVGQQANDQLFDALAINLAESTHRIVSRTRDKFEQHMAELDIGNSF